MLGAAYVTVAALSNFVGALILDRVGRIPLLSESYPSNPRSLLTPNKSPDCLDA